MSLSSALDVARSSLSVTADRSAVVSRNVANANDPSSSRKIAHVVTDVTGAPRLAAVSRSVEAALQDGVTSATSDGARHDALVAAIERLDVSVGDAADSTAPAAHIGKLKTALQFYSVEPASRTSGQAVLSAAGGLASSLNRAAQITDDARLEADTSIRSSVANLNELLGRIELLNTRIIEGTGSGGDVTDDLDARDALIAGVAQEIGVSVLGRRDNGVALYTDGGLTLFDGRARTVSIAMSPLLAGQPGAAVVIDGVAATGQRSVMPVTSGRIAGLVEFRDQTALAYGAQLDEMARGLISAFAEHDQTNPPVLPDAAGLFLSPTLSAVPVAGTAIAGLARAIVLNRNADPARGGDIHRLRDGAISNPGNPAYGYNTAGSSGFSGRIQQLIDAIDSPLVFDSAAQLGGNGTLSEFSSGSVGWLQAARQSNAQSASYAHAALQRSQEALSRVAGINIDDELTQLLELERTYQASSKMIATVDSMFGALLQAVR
jgi:flagellar hook-associated protein 1